MGWDLEFQSTHPARGATFDEAVSLGLMRAFQSTHPARGATKIDEFIDKERAFQSTHPARGATEEVPF